MKDLISKAIENSFIVDTQFSRSNRKKSYFELLVNLGDKKNIIFACIYIECNSPYEIVERTGLPIRTVAARLTELKNDGYIIEAGTKKGIYGKDNTFYRIADRYIPQNVDKNLLTKAIDEYKKVVAETKTYTPHQIRVVLNKVRLNPEMIEDILILLNGYENL